MDDPQRIVKCGNLSLHSPGGFFKKRWHSKYLVLYDGSKSGVKRLELFDSEIKFKKQNPARIIPLIDCVRVVTCQRNKTTYTFEVRTNDQFYLLAAQSFQDMNDWVNCLRLVAFGQSSSSTTIQQTPQLVASKTRFVPNTIAQRGGGVDVLLDKRPVRVTNEKTGRNTDQVNQNHANLEQHQPASAMGGGAGVTLQRDCGTLNESGNQIKVASSQVVSSGQPITAVQAAIAAANALAKTRQRQPSLLGACKPQPPTDSPFIGQTASSPNDTSSLSVVGQLDTLTPTVRGQLISATLAATNGRPPPREATTPTRTANKQQVTIPSTLDEEEENMLYCSIEDNPSEHNYRVKVIETELSLRCQLKCYQLTAPTTICQQYEQLGNFNSKSGQYESRQTSDIQQQPVTFYQLIVGPQELTLLNDYAITHRQQQQQGLWSWPYQCIRRYGFDKDNCFMFEAGRKCNSGPGQFIVQTPKAYNIYQDVVKFVNELRSLGGATTEQPVVANSQEDSTTRKQTNMNCQVVTQIPVVWAPNPNGDPIDPIDNRQQFFSTLRQLDATTKETQQQTEGELSHNLIGNKQEQKQPCTNVSSQKQSQTSPTTSEPQSSSSKTGKQSKEISSESSPSSSIVGTCEETDESGYEQGDDSVDSSTSRFKLMDTVGATRKRLANDSMSSSSSTSSSGGSPGQSVSRRTSGGMNHGQGPSKRPSLNKMTKTQADIVQGVDSSPRTRVHDLIAGNTLNDSNDFETSLIRDVYSEITKLHAKFAVTTASGDDSMSSSSQEDSTADNLSDPNERVTDYYINEEMSEPTYSNLRSYSVVQSRNRSRVNSENCLREEIRGRSGFGLQQQPSEKQPLSNNSYVQNSSNSYDHHLPNGSLFPTILKPIPECGETLTPQPKEFNRVETPRCQSKKVLTSNVNNLKFQPKSGPSEQSRSSKFNHKQPTNHYVINDVQYAKISRNVGLNL